MYSELTSNAPLYSHLPNLTGQVSYTPIVIQFVPSILNADGSPVYKKDIQEGFTYHLRISCPESNKLGTLATLPESYHFEIPADGLLRLQLVPTTTLLPRSYYVVDYFRSNSKKPLLTQHWAVPELSSTAKGTYSFTYEKSTTILPLDVWEILSINSSSKISDNWRSIYNNIFWEAPEPLVGAPMTVVYKQAVTLYDIVLPQSPAHDRTRVRH